MNTNKIIGASKTCPNCGMHNRSGVKLPDNCMWCHGKEATAKVIEKPKFKAKVISVIHHGQEFTHKNNMLGGVEIQCPECKRTLLGCISNAELPPRWGFTVITLGPNNIYKLRCETCECVFSIRVEDNQ